MKYAVKNLELVPESELTVPLTKREVFFSFSVYESLIVREGRPKDAPDHVERFFESADLLRLVHSLSFEDVLGSINLIVEKNGITECTVKLQLIGGPNPLFFAFAAPLPVYPDKYYTDGVKVVSYPGERIMPRVKSNCLLLNYLASRYAQENDALDALLINRNGNAMEGSRCNLFAARDKTLYTPGDNVLFGVTRKHVLELAGELGYDIEYRELALEDLKSAWFDEVFITSTSMGAVPVRMIDDIVIGRNFPLTAILNSRGGL